MASTAGTARQRIAGVIGGMGPQATADFMTRVIAATPASGDQDHIHMLIDHNPTVPNRHTAIAGTAPSVGPQLAAMASTLEAAGADFLVMTCNTAHAYAEEIRAAVDIPFISIIDVVVQALAAHGQQRVGVMAAEGCLQADLYQRALQQAGHCPVLWSEQELEQFMRLITRIKAGDCSADVCAGMAELAQCLVRDGAQILIFGCTEIPLVLSDSNTCVPTLDSTDLLVRRTISVARNDQPLES